MQYTGRFVLVHRYAIHWKVCFSSSLYILECLFKCIAVQYTGRFVLVHRCTIYWKVCSIHLNCVYLSTVWFGLVWFGWVASVKVEYLDFLFHRDALYIFTYFFLKFLITLVAIETIKLIYYTSNFLMHSGI